MSRKGPKRVELGPKAKASARRHRRERIMRGLGVSAREAAIIDTERRRRTSSSPEGSS